MGLRGCAWAFSGCGERGLLFVAVHRLLIAVASPVAEHEPQAHGLQQSWLVGSEMCIRDRGFHCCARPFSSCGERALLFVAVRGLLIVVASLAVSYTHLTLPTSLRV